MLLKRRTWHNIVIGGAAGAFPPLVGYAAVTNHLTPEAWLLFAIIFVWTPVHCWALALLIKDEYARVGIPMLPVVHGTRATVVQILGYTGVTLAITFVPSLLHYVHGIYTVSAVGLDAVLLVGSIRLFRNPERPQASWLFHYSMIYLALLFLMMAIDKCLLH
jgi:protoheme IX farnesyltransferase